MFQPYGHADADPDFAYQHREQDSLLIPISDQGREWANQWLKTGDGIEREGDAYVISHSSFAEIVSELHGDGLVLS